LIPRAPGNRARRSGGTFTLQDNFALLGGVRFAGVTLHVSFNGDLDVLVGWLSVLETYTVRFQPGAPVVLLHHGVPTCSGQTSPLSGFVSVDARQGRVRAADPFGTPLLDCPAMLPQRFFAGVGGQNATIDDLEATR